MCANDIEKKGSERLGKDSCPDRDLGTRVSRTAIRPSQNQDLKKTIVFIFYAKHGVCSYLYTLNPTGAPLVLFASCGSGRAMQVCARLSGTLSYLLCQKSWSILLAHDIFCPFGSVLLMSYYYLSAISLAPGVVRLNSHLTLTCIGMLAALLQYFTRGGGLRR